MSQSLPIGVFDSGLGGLTVLRELVQEFPAESFVYLGDTARLPYGNKSPATIRKYAEQNLQYLLKTGVKAVVIACNSASTQVGESEFSGVPVFTVIAPAAKVALQVSTSGRIGVLGTRATIASGIYKTEILRRAAGREVLVLSQACPLLVPFAEEGLVDDPLTNLVTFRYVSPLIQQKVDTLILGCTHYPILGVALKKAAGESVALVSCGKAVCEALGEAFTSGRVSMTESRSKGRVSILTTDFSDQFETMTELLLAGIEYDPIQTVNL